MHRVGNTKGARGNRLLNLGKSLILGKQTGSTCSLRLQIRPREINKVLSASRCKPQIMKAMHTVSQALKWLAEEPRRCGVCLFELSLTAKPLSLDVSMPWKRVFYTSDTHVAQFSDLERSARRGCDKCASIAAFLDRVGIRCTAIEWHPSRGYGDGNDMRPQLECHLGSGDDGGKVALELYTPPELFEPKGSPTHPSICPGTKLAGSTGGPAAIGQAATWLADCREKHSRCQSKGDGFVPTRLVSIGGEDLSTVFLVEKKPSVVTYAALSHRWSQETALIRLETTNFERRMRDGMPLSSLPRMMQDAILVLRNLGIDFVWIDSLCIVQDSTQDWTREAAMMAQVYSNAEITVAATWCHGSAQSLFSSRDSADFLVADMPGTEALPLFLRRSVPHFQWGNSDFDGTRRIWPLLGRGWVYQEQWLSRRMLHFTNHELLWVCNETTACECAWYQFDGVNQFAPMGGKLSPRSTTWTDIVSQYSEREFTNVTDILPAMAGIATVYSELEIPGRYLCGLWSSHLPRALFWSVTSAPAPRPSLGLPTWTWASVQGNIHMPDYDNESFDDAGPDTEVKDIRIVYSGNDFMGDASTATLLIVGSAVSATLYYGPGWTEVLKKSGKPSNEIQRGAANDEGVDTYGLDMEGQLATFAPDYRLENQDEHNHFVPNNSKVVCLINGYNSVGYGGSQHSENNRTEHFACGLVLRCVDEKKDGISCYERIGSFEGRDSDDGFGLERTVSLMRKIEFLLV